MHKISFWGQTKLYHISQKTFGHTCTIFSCTLQILYLSTKRHIQKNIKVPVGMRHRSYPWKHLQPSTSIFKYSPTSRKLVLIFCQMQLHLHMDLTIPLSLDLCLFFCNKLAPLLEKKNEMAIWDFSWTPDGLFFSMIQAQPRGSPQKKRVAFLFHSSCTLGHCSFLCVFLHVLSWCLMDFFLTYQ